MKSIVFNSSRNPSKIAYDQTQSIFYFIENGNILIFDMLEKTSNKNTANGYCGLNSNLLIPISNIPNTPMSKINE